MQIKIENIDQVFDMQRSGDYGFMSYNVGDTINLLPDGVIIKVRANGDKYYYKDKLQHREGGPAVITKGLDGRPKCYYFFEGKEVL